VPTFEFKLPDVGEGMHEAEILRWLVAPGETVKQDQPMLEIQTDKAVVEIPAPVAGKVQELKFKPGQMAKLGDVLISFETAPANKPSATPIKEETAPVVAVATSNGTNGTTAGIVPRKPGDVRAAPAVRKRAIELDVDIRLVKPSSPDGRVLMQDIEAYLAEQKAAKDAPPVSAFKTPAAEVEVKAPATNGRATLPMSVTPSANDERQALVGLRRRIAERMETSWRTIPHVTTWDEIDGTELAALRERLKTAAEKRGVKITYLPFIVKAVIATLRQYPIFNASFDEATREVIYKKQYHIGLASDTPDGLLVPVVRDADKMGLATLAAEIGRLSEGARTRSLKASELSGSTFTISNVGSFGGITGTAIINPPEAAILATGKLQDKAVVRDGQIVIRPMMPLSLSFDHRLIDGADAGRFMATLKELLENPALLMLDAT
jgi:pyruvate dehydrogenase E2 component (dihydrolipoamide acetyltransferase)